MKTLNSMPLMELAVDAYDARTCTKIMCGNCFSTHVGEHVNSYCVSCSYCLKRP